jgi:HPt (histidine-containing phosphotransfer) domain-containing protein
LTAQDQLRALLTKHCGTINELVERMAGLSAQASDAAGDPARFVAEIREIAHQIKGSSGSIGFPDISVAAAQLDSQLRLLIQGGNHLESSDWQTSLLLISELQRLAKDAIPEGSTLYNVDLSTVTSDGISRRSMST